MLLCFIVIGDAKIDSGWTVKVIEAIDTKGGQNGVEQNVGAYSVSKMSEQNWGFDYWRRRWRTVVDLAASLCSTMGMFGAVGGPSFRGG